MENKKTSKNYCFTPLVSLSTFVIEFALALYAFVKYRKTLFGKLAVITLILLSIFQLAEYNICRSSYTMPWIIIGYLAITFLIPLGVHMNSIIIKKTILTPISYVSAILISSAMFFIPSVLNSPFCQGNFIIFDPFISSSKIIFGAYYFIFIFINVLALGKAVIMNGRNKTLAAWMLAGYASFIIPTAVIFIYEKATRMAVPSIMCGFAVLFAIILIIKILPEFKKYNKN